MSRINTVTKETANAEQFALFDAIQAKLGSVPNFLKILANSPAALRAFLGLYGIANEGSLDPQTRERIALAVAQQNSCEYCVSAHTAIGQKVGLDNAEIKANRIGTSQDVKAAVAIKFARSLLDNMGDVGNTEISEVRAAGYGDAEIVEIISHVAMNIFTNLIGKASHVEIYPSPLNNTAPLL